MYHISWKAHECINAYEMRLSISMIWWIKYSLRHEKQQWWLTLFPEKPTNSKSLRILLGKRDIICRMEGSHKINRQRTHKQSQECNNKGQWPNWKLQSPCRPHSQNEFSLHHLSRSSSLISFDILWKQKTHKWVDNPAEQMNSTNMKRLAMNTRILDLASLEWLVTGTDFETSFHKVDEVFILNESEESSFYEALCIAQFSMKLIWSREERFWGASVLNS